MSARALRDLDPHETAAALVDTHRSDPAWLDTFAESFERRRAGSEVERILRVWGLSKAEAGRLFGISRQAVTKWLRNGVPADRTDQIADLSAATDLLVRFLKRDRIPAVVRRQAPALGGTALIDMLAAGTTRELLEAAEGMFAFGDAHA